MDEYDSLNAWIQSNACIDGLDIDLLDRSNTEDLIGSLLGSPSLANRAGSSQHRHLPNLHT